MSRPSATSALVKVCARSRSRPELLGLRHVGRAELAAQPVLVDHLVDEDGRQGVAVAEADLAEEPLLHLGDAVEQQASAALAQSIGAR